MKVFLTGGTGFIGQALTRQLLQRGWDIIALVRNPQSPPVLALQKLGVKLAEGDVTSIDTMQTAMQGTDMVIHNAGMYKLGIDHKTRQRLANVNINGTENVLRLAQELNIARTVYVSTTWIFGETGPQAKDETFQRTAPFLTYYEETKTRAHEIVKQYQQAGLPLVITCPHGVVGPNDHSPLGYLLRMYLNGMAAPFAWSPDSVFSLVHLDDLAEGIALAAEKGQIGEVYVLSGEPMTNREMYALWATRPGGLKVRFFIPPGLARIMFAPMEPVQRRLGMPAVASRETIQMSSSNLVFSSHKAKDQLGWTHRSAQQMWLDTIEGELALRDQRTDRSPLAMLKPI